MNIEQQMTDALEDLRHNVLMQLDMLIGMRKCLSTEKGNERDELLKCSIDFSNKIKRTIDESGKNLWLKFVGGQNK